MLIFKTKSGVTVKFINNKLYTSNIEEVKRALEEDLNSNDITALSCARFIKDILNRYEVVQTT